MITLYGAFSYIILMFFSKNTVFLCRLFGVFMQINRISCTNLVFHNARREKLPNKQESRFADFIENRH